MFRRTPVVLRAAGQHSQVVDDRLLTAVCTPLFSLWVGKNDTDLTGSDKSGPHDGCTSIYRRRIWPPS